MISLQGFEGLWQLTRQIDDHRAGLTGRFEGNAHWRPDGSGLRQVESGTLCYGSGAPMRGSRAYLWRAEAGGIAVAFEDGRPFHWFSATCLAATHDCPPDRYEVTYHFTQWPARWSTVWQVSGPRKDYRMESVFERAPTGHGGRGQ